MNLQDSLITATKKIMFEEAFYGIFLISLNKEFTTTKVSTAGVCKSQINPQLVINSNYWNSLKEPSRAGMLKHELLHIAQFHITLSEEFSDFDLFNIAADLEINQYIKKDWLEKDWILIENYPELDLPLKAGARQYYKILEEINKKRQQNKNNKDKENKLSNAACNSKIWEYYDSKKFIDSHQLWKEFQNLNEAEKKLIQKQIEYQLKETAKSIKGRGTIPNELKDLINNLFEEKEPVIDWKSYLRRFGGCSNKVYTKKSRRKYNKRFNENPGLKIKTKKHILVFRDTSGSTSEKDHQEFFNEIHHIWKTGVKITLADCDAEVYDDDLYEYKGTPPTHLVGRGGTDFTPAIKYYNENLKIYNSLIYLTDGKCPAPDIKPKTPMLWVISSEGTLDYSKNYPGKVVQIN